MHTGTKTNLFVGRSANQNRIFNIVIKLVDFIGPLILYSKRCVWGFFNYNRQPMQSAKSPISIAHIISVLNERDSHAHIHTYTQL